MIIDSTSNEKVKLLKKLAEKKYRRENGMFVAEGFRLVKDALRLNADVKDVFVSENAACRGQFENAMVLSDKVFASVSDTVSSQGVLATVKIAEKPYSGGKCLVLDGVADPGNVGTILRTAAATGYDDVFLCDSADAYAPKVVRAAMSAHFIVKLHTMPLEQAFETLGKTEIYAADMDGESVFDFSPSAVHALVLGNEANGLSKLSRSLSTHTLSLPMQGGLESLNVAVSGGVIMFVLSQKIGG